MIQLMSLEIQKLLTYYRSLYDSILLLGHFSPNLGGLFRGLFWGGVLGVQLLPV